MPSSRLSWANFRNLFPERPRRRLARALLSLWNCVYGIAYTALLPLLILLSLAAVFGVVSLFLRPDG